MTSITFSLQENMCYNASFHNTLHGSAATQLKRGDV